jgi:hypothetical protein
MSQIPPDPELKEIESMLGELVPRSSRLDRDKLMFQAGAMSSRGARRRAWMWPAMTAVLLAVLCGESLFLAGRPAPQVIERVVFVPAPAPGPAAVAASAGDSERIRGQDRRVIADQPAAANEPWPVDAWPATPDYQRIQAMVMRFGLDAIQEPSSVAVRAEGDVLRSGSGLAPAGALRNIELQKILKPGVAL